MNRLALIQQANPHIQVYSVHDETFRRYGRVIAEDTAVLCAAAETLPVPEKRNCYVASTPELDELPQARELMHRLCGTLDEQIGLCWGHSNKLNALEWHTCNMVHVENLDL